jgi:hypothetical protein
MNLFGLSLVFLTAMLPGLLYGFDIGATSFVLLEDQTTTSTTNMKQHAWKQQQLSSQLWSSYMAYRQQNMSD